MVNITDKQVVSLSQNEIANLTQEVSQDSLIIVDFDETLLLRNSTAEYLNSLQPRLVGSLLLKIISFLKPWQWATKSQDEAKGRDWFLVFFTTILMPWNIGLWQITARQMANKYSNVELIAELNQKNHTNIIIATLGFKFIIKPILNQMKVNYSQLIGCRFWQGLKDREKGKLLMVEESIEPHQIANSILITDSLDDLPLLMKVAKPFLITWNKSQYNYPMSDIYLPMMYIHKVKRVGENYITKSILFDDLPIFLLSLSWLSSQPLLHGIGMLFLVFSFWCIYEFGYYENDLVASKYEEKPNLSDTYYNSEVTMDWWQPWIWSLFLGSIGIVFVTLGNSSINFTGDIQSIASVSLIPLAAWTIFLVISRICFWVYNYVNKQTRIWLYMVLQFCRYCGFLAITGTNLVGMSLLFGQILSRSISYMVYRYAGGKKKDWPQLQEKFLRWLLFVLFIVGLSWTETDFSLLINWQTAFIFIWCLFRGGQHVRQVTSIFGLIQQDKQQ